MSTSFSRTIRYLPIIVASLLIGCSGLEQSEKEKIRRKNCTAEPIYRSQRDFFSPLKPPLHTPRAPYLWESESNLPRITKEFFRCKGSPLNPPLHDQNDVYPDCEGSRHGLPLIYGKEGVYPILLDLLNNIQKKTGKRVIITCGHRCPTHNLYADPSKENRISKHQMGAEVDFYVQGMEDRPQEIVGLLMQYYAETPGYHNQKEYTFQRYEKSDTQIQPWLNKEIFIKLNQKSEGRDADNHHPHPYITLQVRHDRKHSERVVYDWERAHKGYTNPAR